MGLFDGLGEYDSQERRNDICRRQAKMLDEQIAEKKRWLEAKERGQEQPAPQPVKPSEPPSSVSPARLVPGGAPNFQPPRAPSTAQPAQPSFLQQLHQQLLYQPLQLPSLLAQPPQQLPALPALPKRLFELPAFHVRPRALPALPRAESVDSFQKHVEARPVDAHEGSESFRHASERPAGARPCAPIAVPLVPPARRLAETYGAGKLMEELQKVKRSWTEERQELHAEAEALRRQALKLQSEQVVLPSPGVHFTGFVPSIRSDGYNPQVAALKRRDPLPLLPDFRGTLRCLDGGGASLFLLEPNTEEPLAPPVDAGTAAGRLPEGAMAETCEACSLPFVADAKFCGSCGKPRQELGQKEVKEVKEDERGEEARKAAADVKTTSDDETGKLQSTMKSAKEDVEASQFLSSLQYSDSSRTPSADSRSQARPMGFGKVVDLGAELKTAGLDSEKTPISPGRTQDFLISALLNEETGPGVGKPPLAPPGKPKGFKVEERSPTEAPE